VEGQRSPAAARRSFCSLIRGAASSLASLAQAFLRREPELWPQVLAAAYISSAGGSFRGSRSPFRSLSQAAASIKLRRASCRRASRTSGHLDRRSRDLTRAVRFSSTTRTIFRPSAPSSSSIEGAPVRLEPHMTLLAKPSEWDGARMALLLRMLHTRMQRDNQR
jgi:hypothetical protein